MKRCFVRWLGAIMLIPGMVCSGAVLAQAPYPARFVRIIVPFAAGTSPDVVIRLVGQKLSEGWGQQVVVENRPGAAGNIGAGAAASAAADGYALLYTINSVICANPHLYTKLPYDPFKSFAPVSLMVGLGYVLNARSGLGVKTLQELFTLAKAQPGKLTYGSAGAASGPHIVMEMLNRAMGLSMLHVPLGTSSGNMALMSGDVDLAMNPYTTGVPLTKSGKALALGVSLAKRSEALPDVPAIGEVVPGYVGAAWHGLFAPAGTPPAIIDKVAADIAQVLAMPDVHNRLVGLGLEPIGSTPAEFAKIVRDDYEKWGDVIRSAKIRLE